MKQLTIDLRPNKYSGYSSVREFINDVAITELINDSSNSYTKRKQIAADMDMSPSTFSKKLSGNESNVWSSDDTENFMRITKCNMPAKYLAWVYLSMSEDEKDAEIKSLREQLARAENASK